MEDIVVFENVSKVYKDFWGRKKVVAVEGLSFKVRKGQIFGLLGPNGSGKTTSLKLMLNLVFATEGSIWLFEKEPSNISIKKRIGFMPEESYLYQFLNAEESLRFYANFFNIPRKTVNERIDNLLNLVGLEKERSRPVREFSKGMSRRLGLAQALINDPELLLLDEPTSGLDPIGCHEVKKLVAQLKDKGKTIILCSHLLADVEEVCDRIAILHKGKCRIEGTMEELLIQKDRLQITCTGLDEEKKEKVCSFIVNEGGELVSCKEERSRLEDLFVNTIRGNQE